MKKTIALILLLATLAALTACGGGDDGIPDGMQLVRGGEKYGYYMYAPEEWTVSNYGDISTAYASKIDMSSVSYVELPMPEGTLEEYFNESLKEFPEPPTDEKIIVLGEEITFGNADYAVKYVFEHEYSNNASNDKDEEHHFRTMQVFVTYSGRFGIFTFTSPLENISSAEKVQYDYYDEKLSNVIKYFKFVQKSGEAPSPEFVTDADGYRLVSDKSVTKYSLYLPEDYTVEHASGLTVATSPDGSSLTLSVATNTGISFNDYWTTRKTELSELVSDIREIEVDTPAALGNSSAAYTYEYTFVYNNTTYHVYQVLAKTFFNGYVFTYTATEESYQANLDTINKIAEKVVLR